MKMYRNPWVSSHSGAPHAFRSTKEIMKMYRNPYVFNDSGASRALRSTKNVFSMILELSTFSAPHKK
jgi:hypothetical protein